MHTTRTRTPGRIRVGGTVLATALALVTAMVSPAWAADTVAPDTTISAPTAGSSVTAPVSVTGTATDAVGVTAVQVAVKDRTTGSWWTGSGWQPSLKWINATVAQPGSTATTYSWTFAPTGGSGQYRVTAAAKDAQGNRDATKPAVNFSVVAPVTLPTYRGELAGPGLADLTPVDVATTDSRYYAIDVARYRIVAVDRTTGQVVDQVGGSRSSDTGDLAAARAIAVDAAGLVYVADTPNARVSVYSADLQFLRSFGSKGTGPGQFTQVYGLAIGTGKRADGSLGEIVYTVDGDGRLSRWTTGGTYIGGFASGFPLNQPRMAEVSPATNHLWLVNARAREVVVLDVNGTLVRRFGSEGSGPGQFKGDPRGIALNADGSSVFVSDEGNHRVQVFDDTGRYLRSIGGSSATSEYLVDPRGLDVTSSGTVVVSDEWDYGLKEWSAAGVFVRELFGTPAPVGGVNTPRGLAVDGLGRVLVSDWWNQRIQRFEADGSGAVAAGARGTRNDPGSINFAWDVAVQPGTGRVFLANRESHEVEVFTKDLAYVSRWGKRGSAPGDMVFPHGLAFDPRDGTLLVTDSDNGRIQRFRITDEGIGVFVESIGSQGAAVGQLNTPTGIDVAADGTIWVADTRNNRIQKRSPTGTWTAYPKPVGTSVGFLVPWGVTVAPDGRIWVADSGRGRIVKAGTDMRPIFVADGVALGSGPLSSPFEIAFNGGRVYVSDAFNNRVLEFQQ